MFFLNKPNVCYRTYIKKYMIVRLLLKASLFILSLAVFLEVIIYKDIFVGVGTDCFIAKTFMSFTYHLHS